MTREEKTTLLDSLLELEEKNDIGNLINSDRAEFQMWIKTLVQEPKVGKWICTLEDWNKWECSECGFTKRTDVHIKLGYKYCPNCGARMSGVKND